VVFVILVKVIIIMSKSMVDDDDVCDKGRGEKSVMMMVRDIGQREGG
jgi:hypothetical protein